MTLEIPVLPFETPEKAWPTITPGSEGGVVMQLQLNLGVSPVDGDYGPATEEAVKAVQRRVGLPESGIADPETFKRMTQNERRCF